MKKLIAISLSVLVPMTAFSAARTARSANSNTRTSVSRNTDKNDTIEINEDKFTEIYNSNLSSLNAKSNAQVDALKTALSSRLNEKDDDETTDYSDVISCDEEWRKCVISDDVCGPNYILCKDMAPIVFNDVISACPKTIGKCTVSSNTIAQVQKDRTSYAKLAQAEAILNCGDTMASCITDVCGKGLKKCAKSINIAKINCGYIADECSRIDSSLWLRTAQALNSAKGQLNKEITQIENRMAEIESELRAECSKYNFAFDSSKLECVGVVDFRAWGQVLASKRMGSGSTGTCTDSFFDLDITSYRDRAANETIKQKTTINTISGAMLGLGVGSLAGKYGGTLTDKLQGLSKDTLQNTNTTTPEATDTPAEADNSSSNATEGG